MVYSFCLRRGLGSIKELTKNDITVNGLNFKNFKDCIELAGL